MTLGLRSIVTAAAMAGFLTSASPAAVTAPSPTTATFTEAPAQRDTRMAWWRDARFGMFIHWGVYSVPAGTYNDKTGYAEWILESTHMKVSEYEKYAAQFDPEKFNAHDWVATARQAGMKYIVITSKHHDGFDMWPTDTGDWGIKRTPFKRDPLKELSDACNEAGIRFCVYYSIMDWHSSDWGTRRPWNDVATGQPDMDKYVVYMKTQLKELIDRYHPALIWFDGEWESPWTDARATDLEAYLRKLDPTVIINNRIGKNRAGMTGMTKGTHAGDYGTPEQQIPPRGFGPGVDWETCMTLNNHWGYNSHDNHWKSPTTVVHNLVDIASKGGNYLLNVGPTSEGLIPQPSIDCLHQVGQWMHVNGASIYGTGPTLFGAEDGAFVAAPTTGPTAAKAHFKPAWQWRCTTTADTVYVHLLKWPGDAFVLPAMDRTVSLAYMLADAAKSPLKFARLSDGSTHITLPAAATDPIDSVLVLKTEGK